MCVLVGHAADQHVIDDDEKEVDDGDDGLDDAAELEDCD